MQLRIMYRMLCKALNFDFQVIHMHKKQQPKDRNRAFHKSPLSCLLIATLIFSYVSSTIIVHQLQAMAKILGGSPRVSTEALQAVILLLFINLMKYSLMTHIC